MEISIFVAVQQPPDMKNFRILALTLLFDLMIYIFVNMRFNNQNNDKVIEYINVTEADHHLDNSPESKNTKLKTPQAPKVVDNHKIQFVKLDYNNTNELAKKQYKYTEILLETLVEQIEETDAWTTSLNYFLKSNCMLYLTNVQRLHRMPPARRRLQF